MSGINDEILAFLDENGDEKHKSFHGKLTPGTDAARIKGVKVPVLRKYASQLQKRGISPKDIDTYYYEQIMLRGFLTAAVKYKSFGDMRDAVAAHLPYVTDWALCDTFCGALKQTKKFLPEMLGFITALTKSPDTYSVRFAAVMLLSYYMTDEYIDDTLMLLEKIDNDDYYVKMAVAWALSVALVKHYDKTKELMAKNSFDKFTHNKALQKARESYRITAEQKEELKGMKQ